MNVITKVVMRTKKYGLKFVLQVILRNKIYRHVDHLVFQIAKKLWGNHPLQDVILLESHNDFDTNGGAFYNFLIENGYNQKYKIVWLLRNKKPKTLPYHVYGFNMFRPSFCKSYYNCVARYITYDHVPTRRVQSEQKIIYLTHGPFGLKRIKGTEIVPNDVSGILCPSETLAPILAEQYELPYPNDVQLFLGYPIHDALYHPEEGDLKKIVGEHYEKVILWMPTFRKPLEFGRNDSTRELPLGIPVFYDTADLDELNQMLKNENALLIIKIHPMQDMTTVKIPKYSNILVLDAHAVKRLGVDNYRLMVDMDALISDYSSVAYDYLHTGKPIAYTMDDVQDYNVGLIVDNPEEFMAGHIIYNKEQFMGFVRDVLAGNDVYAKERAALLDKVFQYHDGNSCKRLADYLGLER